MPTNSKKSTDTDLSAVLEGLIEAGVKFILVGGLAAVVQGAPLTTMELVQGMRNKKELNSLRKSLHAWNTKLLYVSEEISSKAMFYVEEHFLSHPWELADALIGATAVSYGLPILTGNNKHYKIIKDIQVKSFRP
jgi:predicted nucleic acid-binding protein